MRLLVVLFVVLFSAHTAGAQAPGFYFQDTPDTVFFRTNSEQSIAFYAKNLSGVEMSFYASMTKPGSSSQWDLMDEAWPNLTPPEQVVKMVVTYKPSVFVGQSASAKLYVYDTAYNKCDSIWLFATADTGRASANALIADTLLDFGVVDYLDSKSLPLILTNTHSEPITIDTIMVNGFEFVRQYSLDNLPDFPRTLAANSSDTIAVIFTPDGGPTGGWEEVMVNYHIGEIHQTLITELRSELGNVAVGSADTLHLGEIPMMGILGKRVKVKNNLADTVLVWEYDPFAYFHLVVAMDTDGDSMVLAPFEEKEVIIYGLGMGFPGMESEVQLEFTTFKGPLFHLGWVNVHVTTEGFEDEAIDDADRILPLGANSTLFIPYGTEIEMMPGEYVNFGESLYFENVEDHNINVTTLVLGDSLSTGYILTNFDSLPATLAPGAAFTIDLDRHDSVEAAGWIVIITDSSDVSITREIVLPKVIAPQQSVENVPEKVQLTILRDGPLSYALRSDIESARVTIFDLGGKVMHSGKLPLSWTAPATNAYFIVVEGRKNGKLVRGVEKLIAN